MPEVYTVKVEEGQQGTGDRPARGPVYRSIYAKDGLLELPAGLDSPWDFLRYVTVVHSKYPVSNMQRFVY